MTNWLKALSAGVNAKQDATDGTPINPLNSSDYNENAIAVIGIAGRFPGAPDVDTLWANLKEGKEGITFFDDDTLRAAGIDDSDLARPDFVKAKPTLPGIDLFDAHYFGFNPAEAEQMDPQHRIFLECCVTALEDAGIASQHFDGSVGIFGGSGVSTYWKQVNEAAANNNLWSTTAQAAIGNIQDYLCSRAAYKLNLKGPCYTVQSACSTSLVSVHLASQHLQSFECDVALAGGVSITVPEVSGYFYQENGIVSPDGHCRPFDAEAAGTLFGSGVGVVVLKRLEDAIADRDSIHAVILGSAINNDGELKAAYTAPSVSGQSRAIIEALANAEISPETIGYVEAHGTATPIGDPIEVSALTQAYQLHTHKKQYCTLGSIKSNMGHLDTAAGIAGFIKTVLSLKNKAIAPTLHFKSPNPKIDFENSPFYVSSELQEWPENGNARRAAVSSFGVGGSNAHVILQEAPAALPSGSSEDKHILLLSAKSENALDDLKQDLADHLDEHPDTSNADVLATLSRARTFHNHRFAAVCSTEHVDDTIDILDDVEGTESFSGQAFSVTPQVTFLFPGQGSQYINMGRELYQKQPVFKKHVGQCSELIRPYIDVDLREVIFADTPDESHSKRLQDTQWTQPGLFVIEYSLAQLLMHWGIQPQAMIGHSIGEYVAACIAGVFSLQDALMLVARRGQLVASLPSGSMLAISSPAEAIKPRLSSDLSLAVVNSPNSCVVAGTHEAIASFENELTADSIRSRTLHTSHAFHSHMMEAILPEFRKHLEPITFNAPSIPYLSNLTGTWIKAEEATSPEYWLRHLRRAVLFTDGIQEILKESDQVCFEVGPGHTLTTLSRQQGSSTKLPALVSLLPDAREKKCSHHTALRGIAQAWVAGVEVDWKSHYANETRNTLPLPTYPFQRERYWVESNGAASSASVQAVSNQKQNDINQWFYLPSWKQSPLVHRAQLTKKSVLIIADALGHAETLSPLLQEAGHDVAIMNASGLQQLKDDETAYDTIIHLAGITDEAQGKPQELPVHKVGLESLTTLAQQWAQRSGNAPLALYVIQNNVFSVLGNESLNPTKALTLGPCRVIPQEYPHITCKHIDVDVSTAFADLLAQEILDENQDTTIAYRNQQRWALDFQQFTARDEQVTIPAKNVYWILGGLGGVGLILATALAEIEPDITLVLSNRKELPPETEWDGILSGNETHPQFKAIESVRALRKGGSTVEIVPVDITDESLLAQTQQTIVERHGRINGIIHAAGVAGGKIIERQEVQAMNAVLASKVEGTLNLLKAGSHDSLDFIILCSSLASLTGGIGQLDYVSANATLDAIAQAYSGQQGPLIQSINWDAWLDTGMTHTGKQSLKRDALAIKQEEGIAAFKRILNLPHPQVIISTSPLTPRLSQPSVASKPETLDHKKNNDSPKHSRPALNVDYVAPSTDIEKYWTQTWEAILSIEGIGTQDNFFELGGDSLTALQLTAQVKEEKGWNLSVTQLYQSPTIASLSTQDSFL